MTTGRLWETPFGRILAWKLAFVGAMLVRSVLHDFIIGPASARLAQPRPADAPSSPDRQAPALRRAAAWIGRLNLLLALELLLAVALVRRLPPLTSPPSVRRRRAAETPPERSRGSFRWR
ncbi:MAG: hypothetical protein QN146_08760 [Armatimonadota bacterium]|nr:hypothetical protein [Armatimonadota bacterium]